MSGILKVNTKTKITNLVDAQRAIKELQEIINKLITKVDSPAEKELKESDGASGDIRITRNVDKTYNFAVRTDEGWKTPVIGDNAIAFKDMPKVNDKIDKKSIDEIETNDTSTGATDAKKTIYDEKNDKFVLPRADYESSWLAANQETTVTISHNLDLDALPSLIQVYLSNSSNPVVGTDFIVPTYGMMNENWGYVVKIKDKDTILILIGDDGGLYHPGDNYFGSVGDTVGENIASFANGYIKIFIWK